MGTSPCGHSQSRHLACSRSLVLLEGGPAPSRLPCPLQDPLMDGFPSFCGHLLTRAGRTRI